MDTETPQTLDSLAQEFIKIKRAGDSTNKTPDLNKFVTESADPHQTATDVLQKILFLTDPNNKTDEQIMKDAITEVSTAIANIFARETRNTATTIEIDRKTGKPVILPGFNPRKTFG